MPDNASPVLVTGGTGRLGRVLLPRLVEAGFEVRALVRRPDAALPAGVAAVRGDLVDGSGLAAACEGGAAVVHLASAGSRGPSMQVIDIEGTGRLLDAARAAGSPHVLYLSIVGLEAVHYPYYEVKLAVERELAASGVPWTSLRTTQFHELMREWLEAAVPVFGRGVSFQPVSTVDVADEVVRLLREGPANRVVEYGGPEVLSSEALAATFTEVTGRPAPAIGDPEPGTAAAAFADGGLLAPGHTEGRGTWRAFLAGLGASSAS